MKVYNKNPEKWLDTGCGTGTFIANAYKAFRIPDLYL